MLDDKRLRFVIGHYGSGKTEFSINYAVKLAEMGKKGSPCRFRRGKSILPL